MWGILTALLSGALMSIQGVFNTEVTKQTSTWLAAGWVQISAFAVCLAAWCITGREPIGDLFRVKPWYLLLGGAIGAADGAFTPSRPFRGARRRRRRC